MPKPRRKIIAVVEDDGILQKVLVEWLETEGYKAFGITTGRQALEVIPKKLPDLILLDIILPEISGFQVMQELVANPKTSQIPIIVLTNLGDDSEKRRALEMGAKEYLVKAAHDFPSIKEVIEKNLD